MRRVRFIIFAAFCLLCFAKPTLAEESPMKIGPPPAANSLPFSPKKKSDAELINIIKSKTTFDGRVGLQRSLLFTGYLLGKPNGEVNAKTIEAIRSAQKAYGLDVTGEYNQEFMELLSREYMNRMMASGYKESYPIMGMMAALPFKFLGEIFEEKNDDGELYYTNLITPKGKSPFIAVSFVRGPIRDRKLEDLFKKRKNDILEIKSKNGVKDQIVYSTIRDNWFVIQSSSPDVGLMRFERWHLIGGEFRIISIKYGTRWADILLPIALCILNDFRPDANGPSVVEMEMPEEERKRIVSSRFVLRDDLGLFYPDGSLRPPRHIAALPNNADLQKSTPPPPTVPKDSTGTGFFVSQGEKNVHIVTNAHVVRECARIDVQMTNGGSTSAILLAKDNANDLAVLEAKRNGDLPALPLRPSVKLGEQVAAFGFPLNGLLSKNGNFTLGHITATAGIGDDSRYAQISTPVQPGNSGGPLLDQTGSVVGVVSSKLNALSVMKATGGDIPQNVNFAVKAAILSNFLDANKVPYAVTTPNSLPMKSEELAERAERASVLVVCKNGEVQ